MNEYDNYLFMCTDLYSQGLTDPWGNPLEEYEDEGDFEDEEYEEDE